MKKIIILALSLCLLLSGCGEESQGQNSPQNIVQGEAQNSSTDTSENPQQSTAPENQEMSELDQAKRYYTYLNEVVLDEDSGNSAQRLLPLKPLTANNNPKSPDMYGMDILKKGYTGLLSAFLEDFDHDGTLEMLCVSMNQRIG